MRPFLILAALAAATPAMAQQAGPPAGPVTRPAQPGANLIVEPVAMMIATFDGDGDGRVDSRRVRCRAAAQLRGDRHRSSRLDRLYRLRRLGRALAGRPQRAAQPVRGRPRWRQPNHFRRARQPLRSLLRALRCEQGRRDHPFRTRRAAHRARARAPRQGEDDHPAQIHGRCGHDSAAPVAVALKTPLASSGP